MMEMVMREKMTEFNRKSNNVQGMGKEEVIREFELHWQPVEDQDMKRIQDAMKPREEHLECSLVSTFQSYIQ